MHRAILAFGALIFASSAIVGAQTQGSLDDATNTEMARWAAQKTSAKDDEQLAGRVMRAFLAATSPVGRSVSPLAVNASLMPLSARFPDYRLNYESDRDYCPALRAIQEARDAALRRLNRALEMQEKVLLIANLHNELVVQRLVERIMGARTGDGEIDAVFRRQLNAVSVESTEAGWSNMDFRQSPWAEEHCN